MKRKEIVILDCILNSSEALTFSKIVEKSTLPKTSVHRFLSKLVVNKLLHKAENRFFLGPVMLRWMNSNLHQNDFITLIHPHLEALQKRCEETVHLVQLQGSVAVYRDKVKKTGSIQLASRIGSELSLYSTAAGRALLMLFSADELEAYFKTVSLLPRTDKTVTDPKLLKEHIADFKKQHYALEIEQNEDKIQCLGAPLLLGNTKWALSVTMTLLTPQTKLKKIAQELRQVCQEIQREVDE